jgi:ABC-type sugar transport system substrate-binding protein
LRLNVQTQNPVRIDWENQKEDEMRKLKFVTVVLVSMAMLVSCASPTPATIIQTVEVPVVQTQVIKETQVVVVKETQVVPTAAPVAEGPMEIAVIVKTGNSSFWQNVQTGAMDAQKELKAQTPKLSVTFLGAQSESNINEEINIVESAIDRGVKAIAQRL